jgi:hypothetical protein
MPVIATTAIVYGVIATNTYDRQKFQAASQPYQPSRIVSCPLNESGRPQNCRVETTGRFANPYAGATTANK